MTMRGIIYLTPLIPLSLLVIGEGEGEFIF
jgi:hypothetical protein